MAGEDELLIERGPAGELAVAELVTVEAEDVESTVGADNTELSLSAAQVAGENAIARRRGRAMDAIESEHPVSVDGDELQVGSSCCAPMYT